MQKIISLFKRNYDGDRLVYDEVVPGAEWVLAGEGRATQKWDGTCCLLRGGLLYKRYDRKLTKAADKRRKRGEAGFTAADCKLAPEGWEPCEESPDPISGHWPGWLLVGDGPEDRWHREAWDFETNDGRSPMPDGTYELCGPEVQGNPEKVLRHVLFAHGWLELPNAPRTFDALREWFTGRDIEGIVWHHPDGRAAKIKGKDFGIERPAEAQP